MEMALRTATPWKGSRRAGFLSDQVETLNWIHVNLLGFHIIMLLPFKRCDLAFVTSKADIKQALNP